jgi:hypothetical protein
MLFDLIISVSKENVVDVVLDATSWATENA